MKKTGREMRKVGSRTKERKEKKRSKTKSEDAKTAMEKK